MTAPTTHLATPVSRAGTLSAHRVLGALGMLGAPAFLFIWQHVEGASLSANLLMTAYLAGWVCSPVGLRRLRATGHGRGAGNVFAVQMLGLALALCQQPQDEFARRPLGDAFYTVCDLAWPFSHVFMLVVFAAVWRTGVWTGWRRWTPLACGLVLPLTIAGAATKLFSPGALFNFGTALSFLAFGLAVCTARSTERAATASASRGARR